MTKTIRQLTWKELYKGLKSDYDKKDSPERELFTEIKKVFGETAVDRKIGGTIHLMQDYWAKCLNQAKDIPITFHVAALHYLAIIRLLGGTRLRLLDLELSALPAYKDIPMVEGFKRSK